MRLEDTINKIKGVGEKSSALFHKIGVDTIEDLIHLYPRYYLTYDAPVEIEKASEGKRVAIQASIASHVEVRSVRSLKLVTCMVKDMTGALKLTWFHMPYLKHTFHIGQTFVFVGVVSVRGSQLVMEHPEFYSVEAYKEMMLARQPVYPLTEGLSNKLVTKAMVQALPLMSKLADPLPEIVKNTWNLMLYSEALVRIHFPESDEIQKRAFERMVFDEFFFYLAGLELIKEKQNCTDNHFPIAYAKEVDDIIAKLPYQLTGAQQRTFHEICTDLSGEHTMNRLVQGDVGSGKTIVAVLAFLMTVKAGYQCAFMVPTEVLAYQHFETILALLADYDVNIGLLTGTMSIKEKRHIHEKIKHHELDLVIGTHALIQEKVEFASLALVVTDEQHRFGVKQRQSLSKKGIKPHVMVMSATPIPRTLALILYGDLDISIMDEMPAERLPIKNCVVGTNYRASAYRFIEKEVLAGHQVYVICPMIEESEKLEAENVISYTDTLKAAVSENIRIQYLHGKMTSDEKNNVMRKYCAGDIDVLVSTTVIEVGIDNPNATVMMIENAERFGLAQLHQLRGRVGRGSAQSYCIFVCGKDTKEAFERLEVMSRSNDGFFIANEDLRLRGPGDFFGYRQSGQSCFALADIYRHADILKAAKDAVTMLEKNGYDFQTLMSKQLKTQMDISMNL